MSGGPGLRHFRESASKKGQALSLWGDKTLPLISCLSKHFPQRCCFLFKSLFSQSVCLLSVFPVPLFPLLCFPICLSVPIQRTVMSGLGHPLQGLQVSLKQRLLRPREEKGLVQGEQVCWRQESALDPGLAIPDAFGRMHQFCLDKAQGTSCSSKNHNYLLNSPHFPSEPLSFSSELIDPVGVASFPGTSVMVPVAPQQRCLVLWLGCSFTQSNQYSFGKLPFCLSSFELDI